MTSHGIADELLTDTPSWWRDYGHAKDIYTAQEGQSAEDAEAAYKIIMGARVLQGPNNLLAQFLELTQNPIPEAIAMFKAITDAGLFFANGTGPHVNYSPQAAIDYLLAA
jgi:fumarate reductase subunit C